MAEFMTDIMVFFGCYETIRHCWVAYEEKVYGFAQTSDIHTIIALGLTIMTTIMFHTWRNEEKIKGKIKNKTLN